MTATNEEEPGAAEPMDTKLPPYVPGPTATDVTPLRDGGVLKEILREGTGTETPLSADKVFVHYVGTLTDGTKFDSSRDRNQPFEFKLGMGAVIKAWDLGVATMKRGELAVLQCRAEYAYGEGGSLPKIPPGATLVFEVELFDWKGEDVSENKDGGVLKSMLHQGGWYQTPKDGATCDIHLVGRCAGREFERRDVSLVLGEGSEAGVVSGVEHALKSFKKGETARLAVKAKHAYGAAGCEALGVPPNADLEYDVTLKAFEKSKESWEMDMKEKLEQSEMSKAKGTQFFKAGKYALALHSYQRIIDLLKSEETLKEGEAESRRSLQLAAQLNAAMCYLKLGGRDLEAVSACDEALKLDPKNEKGLFRRGSANLTMQYFDAAIADFKAVLEVDPDNKAAKAQMAVAVQRKKAAVQKERQMYASMFSKSATAVDDTKKETSHGETKSTNSSKANQSKSGEGESPVSDGPAGAMETTEQAAAQESTSA